MKILILSTEVDASYRLVWKRLEIDLDTKCIFDLCMMGQYIDRILFPEPWCFWLFHERIKFLNFSYCFLFLPSQVVFWKDSPSEGWRDVGQTETWWCLPHQGEWECSRGLLPLSQVSHAQEQLCANQASAAPLDWGVKGRWLSTLRSRNNLTDALQHSCSSDDIYSLSNRTNIFALVCSEPTGLTWWHVAHTGPDTVWWLLCRSHSSLLQPQGTPRGQPPILLPSSSAVWIITLSSLCVVHLQVCFSLLGTCFGDIPID